VPKLISRFAGFPAERWKSMAAVFAGPKNPTNHHRKTVSLLGKHA
jgi:hypothetical protein